MHLSPNRVGVQTAEVANIMPADADERALLD